MINGYLIAILVNYRRRGSGIVDLNEQEWVRNVEEMRTVFRVEV